MQSVFAKTVVQETQSASFYCTDRHSHTRIRQYNVTTGQFCHFKNQNHLKLPFDCGLGDHIEMITVWFCCSAYNI